MAYLPLPQVIPDVGPGGGLVTALRGMNALTQSALQNQSALLKNQNYVPDIQSQIAYRNALSNAQNIRNQYLPDQLKFANAFANLRNQNYVPDIQSQINARNALTNKTNIMTPLDAQNQKNINDWYVKNELSKLATQKAQQNYYNMGGGRGGVGAKDQYLFQNIVSKDNPDLTPDQVYEASNVLMRGGNTLSDGTKLNPMSAMAQQTLDRIIKYGSTAGLVTQGVRANQAEKEVKVLNDYAQKGLEPYGTTYNNYSPQQIVDSFKSDENSQKKLGKFIAAQALQYEIAQNRIKLANGQPGVTSSEELMKLSGQLVNAKYPKLSYSARKEAARYMDEALEKGLEARQSIGIGASSATGKKISGNKKRFRYNMNTGNIEELS